MPSAAKSTLYPPYDPPLFTGGGTFLVGLAVLLLGVHVQLLVLITRVYQQFESDPLQNLLQLLLTAEVDGAGVSWGMLASAFVTVFTIRYCVRLRTDRSGPYLGLRSVGLGKLLLSLVAIFALGYLFEVIIQEFHIDITSKTMRKAYANVESKPLFWLAVVVATPISEEFLTRGFLFAGWREKMGGLGTILVVSLIWTIAHLQYGAEQWIIVFVLGLALGIAREFTGSLYAPIAMHMLNNGLAIYAISNQVGPTP